MINSTGRLVRWKACQDCGADIRGRGNAARRCTLCAQAKKARYTAKYRKANREMLRDNIRASRQSARRRADNREQLKDLAKFIAECKASGLISSVSAVERGDARRKANRAFLARSRKIAEGKKRVSPP